MKHAITTQSNQFGITETSYNLQLSTLEMHYLSHALNAYSLRSYGLAGLHDNEAHANGCEKFHDDFLNVYCAPEPLSDYEVEQMAMEDGEQLDMFAHVDFVPSNVRDITESLTGDQGYEFCADMIAQLESLGWTADFGLDGELHSLRPVSDTEWAELQAKMLECTKNVAPEPTAPRTTTPCNLYVLVDSSEVVTVMRKHFNVWECDHSEEHQVALTNVLRDLVDHRLDHSAVYLAQERVSMGIEFDEYCIGLLDTVDTTDFEQLYSSVNALAASYIANEIAHYLLNSYAAVLIDTKTGSIENTKFGLKLN